MKKILFMRHGESTDDIDKQYGGWADFELTNDGVKQIEASAEKIKSLGVSFEKVYTSPLKRARKSGEIVAETLGIEFGELELVKEMNRYGILSGMTFEEGKKKYPEIAGAYDKDEWIVGGERYEDLVTRVKLAVDYILGFSEDVLIVVTHGNFLKCLFKEVFKKELTKKSDGGFVLAEYDGEWKLVKGDGIEWK
jgi:broad specificity phosphatase PhoE